MMKNLSDYAVVYDITDDKERIKIARVLKNYGFRVQKSVFECRLTKKMKQKMIDELAAIQVKTGSIKIYRLEYSWQPKVIGKKAGQNPDDDTIFFV